MTIARPRLLLHDADSLQSKPCRLFAAWLADHGRTGGAAPKSKVDPQTLRGILPHIMLMDVEPAGPDAPAGAGDPRFRYRLVGEHIAEHYEPLKGRYVDELELGAWRDYWLEAVARPARELRATCDLCSVEWQGRDHLLLEYIFAPVVADGTDRPVQLICCVSFFYEADGTVLKTSNRPPDATPPLATPISAQPDR